MIPRLKPYLGLKELFRLFLPASKKNITHFENEFALLAKQKYAVFFPYGRTGLIFILKAFGIENAEVICPAYTCVAVAHAIVYSKNTPVFVDSQESDFNMNLDLVENAITSKTKAIIATSIFGYPINLEKLEKIKQKHPHILIFQDCAHSFFAEWKGKPVNQAGECAFYGLNISKLITSIWGGMVTTDNIELVNKLYALRDTQLKAPGFLQSLKQRFYLLAIFVAFSSVIYRITHFLERCGLLDKQVKYYDETKIDMPQNYLENVSAIQAVIGREQIKRYQGIINQRREVAKTYVDALEGIQDIKLPPLVQGATYSHFVIRMNNREAILAAALKRGVQLGKLIEYSVPNLAAYKASSSENCSVALKLSNETINLPIWCGVDSKAVIDFFKNNF